MITFKEFLGESLKNPHKKGTMKWEIWERNRQDYLKGFAKDPHGKLKSGDKVGNATVKEEQKWKVHYDIHGSNQNVPLYSSHKIVRAKDGHEAIATIKSLIGGRNHKAELVESKDLDVPTPSAEAIAKKFGVSVADVEKQVAKGVKDEMAHTTHKDVAREIALDHISKKLDYYDKLEKVEEAFANKGSGSTGISKEDKRIAAKRAEWNKQQTEKRARAAARMAELDAENAKLTPEEQAAQNKHAEKLLAGALRVGKFYKDKLGA